MLGMKIAPLLHYIYLVTLIIIALTTYCIRAKAVHFLLTTSASFHIIWITDSEQKNEESYSIVHACKYKIQIHKSDLNFDTKAYLVSDTATLVLLRMTLTNVFSQQDVYIFVLRCEFWVLLKTQQTCLIGSF